MRPHLKEPFWTLQNGTLWTAKSRTKVLMRFHGFCTMDYFRKYHFCRFYYGSHLRKAEEGRGKREGEGARGAPFDSFQSKLDINLTIFFHKKHCYYYRNSYNKTSTVLELRHLKACHVGHSTCEPWSLYLAKYSSYDRKLFFLHNTGATWRGVRSALLLLFVWWMQEP